MARGSERLGGWGALAQGALTLAAFGAGLAVLMTSRGLPRTAPLPLWPVVLASVVAVASGLAQLAAVRGLQAALAPASRVGWAAAVAGWSGAAVLGLGGLTGLYGALAPAPGTPVAIKLGEVAPLLVAVWAIAACAAAWRAGRLPAGLKVVGVAFGAATLASPALGLMRLVALPTGLVWWFGLGAVLLRLARSPAAAPSSAARL